MPAKIAPKAKPSPLMREREVVAMLGLGRYTIRRLEASGDFPKRCAIPGARCVRWSRADVEAYLSSVLAPALDSPPSAAATSCTASAASSSMESAPSTVHRVKPAELARMLGVSRQAIHDLIKRKVISKDARCVRWSRDDVEAYLSSGLAPASDSPPSTAETICTASTESSSMESAPSTAHRVKPAELARMLGVSRQAIHDLIKRKVISRDGDGLIAAEMARIAIANRVRPSGKTAAAITTVTSPLNFVTCTDDAQPLKLEDGARRFWAQPVTFVFTLAQPVTGAMLHFEVDADGACVDNPERRFDAALIASRMDADELQACEGGECTGEWLIRVAGHLGPVAAGAAFLS
jgi:predicted DNA-binding transcriptional regulator AlpA